MIKEGKIKLFEYYFTESQGGVYVSGIFIPRESVTECDLILENNEDILFRPKRIYFRKKMAIYLSDCPELVEKIKNRKYRYRDLEKIVNEYNKSCFI